MGFQPLDQCEEQEQQCPLVAKSNPGCPFLERIITIETDVKWLKKFVIPLSISVAGLFLEAIIKLLMEL
jgi:hypothetical protein